MLQTSDTKTTLIFSPAFHERLKRVSQSENKSMSQFVEDELNKLLKEREQQHVQHVYAGLRQLAGSGPAGIRDLSTTAETLLYTQQSQEVQEYEQ